MHFTEDIRVKMKKNDTRKNCSEVFQLEDHSNVESNDRISNLNVDIEKPRITINEVDEKTTEITIELTEIPKSGSPHVKKRSICGLKLRNSTISSQDEPPESRVIFKMFSSNCFASYQNSSDYYSALNEKFTNKTSSNENETSLQFNTFEEAFTHLESAMSRHKQFCMSLLLKVIDQSEKQQFPYIHYAVFDPSQNENSIDFETNWHQILEKLFNNNEHRTHKGIWVLLIIYPQIKGVYQQYQNIIKKTLIESDGKTSSTKTRLFISSIKELTNTEAFRTEIPILPLKNEGNGLGLFDPLTDDTVYLISIFKTTSADSTRLERNWPIWTGANIILRPSTTSDGSVSCSGGYIPPELFERIRRVTFYKNSHEQVKNKYILLVEFCNASSVLFRIKDLVLRFNERQCGLTAAYKIEKYRIAPKFLNKASGENLKFLN